MRAKKIDLERDLLRQLDRCYKRQTDKVQKMCKEYYDYTAQFLRFYAWEFSGKNFAHVAKRHLIAYVKHLRKLGYTERDIYKNIEGIIEIYPMTCGRNWFPAFRDLGVKYEGDCSDYLMNVLPNEPVVSPELDEEIIEEEE